jgi:hypothetical protein
MSNSFSITCLVTSLLSFVFSLLIFLNLHRAPKAAPVRLWAAFCLAVCFWSLGLGFMTMSKSQEVATFWLRIHYFGAIFIPTLFLHFILTFLQIERNHKTTLIVCYVITLGFHILSIMGQLASVIPKPPFTFYTALGKYYNLYSLYFFVCVLYGHILLYKASRREEGFRRNQIYYLFLGTAIGFSGGSTAFLPVYNIPVFPFGMYLVALYIFIVGYSILIYRLMDFSLVMRWGLAYGTSIALLGSVYLLATLFIEKYFHLGRGIPTLIAVCLAVFLLEPMRRRINTWVDKIIFKSPDFQALLNGIEEEIKNSTSIESLAEGLTENLKKIYSIEHAGFMLWESKTSTFQQLPKSQFESQTISKYEDSITSNDFLVRTLESERRLFPFGIIVEEEVALLAARSSPGEKTTFSKIRRTLRWLGASVCVPLMSGERLLGFFILGPKKNKTFYNNEDKKFLSHVSEKVSGTIHTLLDK